MGILFNAFTAASLLAYECKCYPGDSCWPNEAAWTALGTAAGGNLKKVIPPGAACYNSFDGGASVYNAQSCQAAITGWQNADWQVDQEVTNMWPLSTGNTCNPSQNQGGKCTIGNLPQYVILAKTKEDIKAGVDFARENNIRLVIRNTGHDFMGRTTGFGSLAINTHSFKKVEFIKSYTGPGGYTGGAVKVGAGIETRELYTAAFNQEPKVLVVGGECPTVGIAGGYVQGGGHSPLSSVYGLGADNALEFEAVTAAGEFVTANAEENADLFWALRGGGPSSFAVVHSVTFKTYPELKSTGTAFSITTQNQDLFWKGFTAFHNLANHFVDHGLYVWFALSSGSLSVQPFVGPGQTAAQQQEILKPLFDKLKADGVTYTATTKEYPTWFQLYTDLFADDAAGFQGILGGRIFTRRDISENGDKVAASYRAALTGASSGGGFGAIGGHIVGPGVALPTVDNAVHPAWRNASVAMLTILSVAENANEQQKQAARDRLTNNVDKPLRDASPYGAAYVNEGNLDEPNWQEAYWGSNYPRLLELRKKWDGEGVFYAKTTPGTEDWEVIENGTKLCKKV
ncbi:FAD binding domain-containing protein [Peziza echinospora]|nr:FAD binding domain-containing protein [Peziza echinospora]